MTQTATRSIAHRALISLAVVSAAVLVSLFGTASPANATAVGCSYWNNLGSIKGVPVYSGNYCVTLAGQGTYAAYVRGGFASVGNVCNWSVTAEFFTASGQWYRTLSSPTQWGCSRGNGYTIGVYGYVQRGFMCSTLKTNGARITSVCHNIY
jgi:hypothetical protein